MKQKQQHTLTAVQKAESSSASLASAKEVAHKEHAAALDALKKGHESAIETMRKDHTAALQNQSHRLQDEARKKADAHRRDLIDKADREKDELHRRIAAADIEKESALRDLGKAKQEAEEIIKKQTEKARSDMNNLQSQLRTEAQQESDKLTQSHSREQEVLRERATRAETELESLRNILQAQLAKPSPQSQRSQLSQPSQPSHIGIPTIIPSAEPVFTPFKKPRRKVDRREPARPSSHMFSDNGASLSLQNATSATSRSQWPKIRTFSEIDSMISESFQIFEDPQTSSELSDVPSSLPSDPRVLQELPVTDPRGNTNVGTASSNGSVSNPFFGPARPRSTEQAPANSAMRMAGGSTQANSSVTASRITETRRQSLSAAEDLPFEVEGSQTESRRSAFAAGKENRAPVNGAPKSGQSATRSAHFQTPKPKDKRAVHDPTRSSSPDYLGLSQPRSSQKMTTYGHSKQANGPSSGHNSQSAARGEPLSSVKRRLSTNAAEDTASKKRSKTAREQSMNQFEIPESQSQDIESQRVAETQLEHLESDSQHSQVLPRSTVPSVAANRMLSLSSASPRPTSQPRPSSAERASLSRARTSNSTRASTAATTNNAANRGKGRTVSGRSSTSRYDLRFSQELDG
ncbi:hypothetical protein FKW77_009319 [Venturia effusa]|uniref:Uncharacterized protein n=1 Tax=Venturia effusa TaxID=50376 RepID=A0A517L9Y3_9PEZI|nr:hypothetical protein FKW77_009319 [Venturia effusa]